MKERLGYRPELDGLRGVAVILVVAAHSLDRRYGFFAGGALGVDVFFVLSGFLITALLLDEWDAHGAISIRGFYVRRMRRLLPALYVLLFGAAAIEAATGSVSAALVRLVVRGSYLVNFVGAAVGERFVGAGFLHLWTLGLEEQFYLVWPIVLIVLLRRNARPRHLLLVIATVIVLINLNRIANVPGGNWRRVNYLPDTHGDVILFGCAAAIIWRSRKLTFRPWLVVAAVATMAGTVAWFRETNPSYLIPLPLFAIAVCVVIIAALAEGSAAGRLLRFSPLRRVGKLSYSLYLWHVPLIAALGVPLGLPLALCAAGISYRFVEQPFRRRRVRVAHAAHPVIALSSHGSGS